VTDKIFSICCDTTSSANGAFYGHIINEYSHPVGSLLPPHIRGPYLPLLGGTYCRKYKMSKKGVVRRSVSRRRGTQSRQKFTKGTVYSNLTGDRLEVLSMSSLWKPWSFEKESVCKKRIQEPLWALCVLSQAWCSPWCKVFILNQIKYNYLITLLNNILKVKTRN
jgi:hypothetical protein